MTNPINSYLQLELTHASLTPAFLAESVLPPGCFLKASMLVA